eukprot:TRINITY_DN6053_c0_g1_i2.p1 TRINITY_DN6053_c0_g1~~TRINITY_DN6053_c0_g1_i2.p1  ORF type:complete len:118 (-),score=14.10 TRINITY_DN6053_c0_g1_i2:90-443(-)
MTDDERRERERYGPPATRLDDELTDEEPPQPVAHDRQRSAPAPPAADVDLAPSGLSPRSTRHSSAEAVGDGRPEGLHLPTARKTREPFLTRASAACTTMPTLNHPAIPAPPRLASHF